MFKKLVAELKALATKANLIKLLEALLAHLKRK
jgi:hypothetical protein